MKNWTFAGVYHTSNIDRTFLRSVSCMQEVDPSQVDMVMEVYRDGEAPKNPQVSAEKNLGHLKNLGWAGLAAGALVACVQPLGGLLLGALGLATHFWAGKAEQSLPPLQKTPNWHQERLWPETRTLHLTASSSRSKEALDSPVLAHHPLERPTAQQLGERLASTFAKFPSHNSAVVLGGHGLAYSSWSSYSLDEVAEMLGAARQGRNQEKIDLVVFDSCLMGNLEALHKLTPHARYAVASEQIVFTSDRPWSLALDDLGGSKGGPKQLGEALVKAMGAHNETPTLALIDLQKLPALVDKVERLAEELQKDPDRASQVLDVSAFASYQRQRWQVTGDLGQILGRAEHYGIAQEVVKDCQAALAEAVVARKNRGGYDFAQGLSIQIPSQGFDRKAYLEKTGLSGWAHLLARVATTPDEAGRHLWAAGTIA